MDDELTEAELEAWCAERRAEAFEHLRRQGVEHGGIGEWPAWHEPPFVSVWAVESLEAPGWVGWWVICGDLPTDYCSADGCRHPRLAVERIVDGWRDALANTPSGAESIGKTGLPVALAPLLRARAQVLLECVEDESIWPE